MLGRGTAGNTSVMPQLQEKVWCRYQDNTHGFQPCIQACHLVDACKYGIEECLVRHIESICENDRSRVRVGYSLNKESWVSIHQAVRRITAKPREVSKLRDWML